MQYLELKNYLQSKEFKGELEDLYSTKSVSYIENQKNRYLNLLEKTHTQFGDGDFHIISSPGRTEICGNHTDHQGGVVVCSGINIDNIAIIKKRDDNIVNIIDDKIGKITVDLSNLSFIDNEKHTTESIIRGCAYKLNEEGFIYGGFDCMQDTNVLFGSGLSSSACFENMIVEILNYFYNDEKIDDINRAIYSRWVENNYFCKPCGLMDQMAISKGNFVGIDFQNKDKPIVTNYNFDFSSCGYRVIIINTKGSHQNLNLEYSNIPGEMKMVATYFGKELLSEVNYEDFLENISIIRNSINNDRAILRALHYFEENERSKKFLVALKNKNIDEMINIFKESGNSSYMYLQNVYPSSNYEAQNISIGIAMSKKFFENDGAFRVHGGGFQGTMISLIKTEKREEYKNFMKKIFGEDSVLEVKIRKYGTKIIL